MTEKFDRVYQTLISKFGKSAVKKGYDVEKEHHKSPEETLGIAKDHLEEFPTYYSELSKMEKKLEKKKKKS